MKRVLSVVLGMLIILGLSVQAYALNTNNIDAQSPFKDVSAEDWFYESVDFCYKNGIMKGTSSEVFDPNENLSRAMIVTVLYRIAGEPDIDETKLPRFKDISADSWYYNAVCWAFDKKITNGRESFFFCPDNSVTRAELATFILRYVAQFELKLDFSTDDIVINDYKRIPEYAQMSVISLYRSGILKGKSDNNFAPNSFATRAEIAVLLSRFLDNTSEQDFSLLDKYGLNCEFYAYINQEFDLVYDDMYTTDNNNSDYGKPSITISLVSDTYEYPDKDISLDIKVTNKSVTVDLPLMKTENHQKVVVFVSGDHPAVYDLNMKVEDMLIVEYTVTIGEESETYTAYPTVRSLA